jgi:hypothetical protein
MGANPELSPHKAKTPPTQVGKPFEKGSPQRNEAVLEGMKRIINANLEDNGVNRPSLLKELGSYSQTEAFQINAADLGITPTELKQILFEEFYPPEPQDSQLPTPQED